MTDDIDLSVLSEHPAAKIFPMMSDREIEVLANDIKANGLKDAVDLCRDGEALYVLDGRNRLRACAIAGVVPRLGFRDEPDPAAYVLSKNLHRRHLTESQRAMVAARLANLQHGQRTYADLRVYPAVTQDDAAARLNVGKRTVQCAKAVIESGQEMLIKDVDEGRLAVSTAADRLSGRSTIGRESPPRIVALPSEAGPKPDPWAGRRVDHEKRATDVKRLHLDGLGTNEIARALNMEGSSVSEIKGRLGIANTGGIKLWGDVEHLVASLSGVAQISNTLVTRLGTQKTAASQEEVQRCIKTLAKVQASIRALSGALKENSK